jgi:lipoprotein NlpI
MRLSSSRLLAGLLLTGLLAAFAAPVFAQSAPIRPAASGLALPEMATTCLMRYRDVGGPLKNCTLAIEAGGMSTELTALVYNVRGEAYCTTGQYDLALADQNKAISLVPNFPEAYIDRASCYIGKQDQKTALANYDEAIRLSPTTPGYYRTRAKLENWMGLHDRALADYDEAIRRAPLFTAAVDERAKTLFDLGRYNEAAAAFATDTQMMPGDPRPVLWLHVARLRAHTPDAEEFQAGMARLDLSGVWPRALFDLFVGKMPINGLSAASMQSPDGFQAGSCESTVFGGEYYLTHADPKDATDQFQLAIHTCDKSENRYLTAWAELKRLVPAMKDMGPW